MLRLGDEQIAVRGGSYIALPVGPDHAHQLTNCSDATLVYLVFSTMHATDVAVFSDSGKIGIYGGAAPGGDKSARFIDAIVRDVRVDYWEGE